jgi:hypothetical protein
MNLSRRAGIDYLGKYLSSSPRWARAQEWLSRNIEQAAIDYTLLRKVYELGTDGGASVDVELDVVKDNRSVTSPEWIQTGLYKFGCPVHGTRRESSPTGSNPSSSEITVSGIGPCSCGGRARRNGDISASIGAGSRRAKQVQQARKRGRGTRSADYMGRERTPAPGESRDGNSHRVQPHRQRTVFSDRGVGDSVSGGVGSWRPEIYGHAVSAAFHVAGNTSRRDPIFSIDEVVQNHIHRNKYAGAPFFTHNEHCLDAATRRAERLAADAAGFDPYLVGRRVQPGASGPKTRLVWMAPIATTIVASRFSKPISKRLARRRPFAYGLRQWDKSALVAGFRSRFRYVYSLDFSGFDASIPAHIIDDAFGLLATYLEMSDEETILFKRIQNDFIHSQLLTPEGEIYQVHKGVPSGNPFTSLIDSVVNLIVVQYMWLRVTGNMIPGDSALILGDDVIIARDERIPLSKLAKAAAELGFTLSVEKSEVARSYRESDLIESGQTTNEFSDQVYFLGHYWVNGRARRPMKEVLQRQVFPERHKSRSVNESLLRLYSYIPDCLEGFILFRTVYKNPDIAQACVEALRDIGSEVDLATFDLPGRLRMLFDVEDVGEFSEPIPMQGLGLAFVAPMA